MLLRDGNLSLVLLDFQAVPLAQLPRIPASTWHRFQRLPDSADEEYLWELPATPTTLSGHEYFLVELSVTQELLDELMGDDSVSGSTPSAPAIPTLAEIRCTLNGLKISSATFTVTFVEDVDR